MSMRQRAGMTEIATRGPGLYEITERLDAWLGEAEPAANAGLLTLLCQHTSASLTIQENASPDVGDDLGRAFERLAPRDARYAHALEGPDDMPAHIRSVLSGVNLSIPIRNGAMALGTWQGVFLWEHRDRPHRRRIALHLLWDG